MENKEKVSSLTSNDNSNEPAPVFICSNCSLKQSYDYKGCNPPFAKNICTIDESYIMKDPFSPSNKNEFLILGADCSICKKSVCVATNCSIFFKNTFCKKCAIKQKDLYPERLQKIIEHVFK